MNIARLLPQTLACAALAAALALGACGGNSDSDGTGGSVGGTGGNGGSLPGTGGDNGGTGGDKQPGGCKSTADCREGEICNVDTGACTAEPVSCVDHEECGPAAFCDEGVCTRNSTGGPCTSDSMCQPGESCTGGYCGCAGSEYEAESVPPNVLIMLDKSGSMDRSIGSDTKWNIAVQAIETLVADFGDQIRFGLVVYPEGRSCDPGNVVVEIGDGTASDIVTALANTRPVGSTPIGASLEAMLGYDGLKDPMRQNFVLMITDGEEQCRGDGESAVEALRALDPEVKTFVVGFGSGVDASELNAMAVAGGTELAGETKYYQADDAASLQQAFADIGGEVLGCAYQIEDVGLKLKAEDIYIYFDGEAVEHDPTGANGWEFESDTNQVIFHGPACEALRSGIVEDLVIVHGCPIIIG